MSSLTFKKFRLLYGAGVLSLLFQVSPSWAVPVISVDLDPGTGGIQSTLTVDPGEMFTVDIVYTGDGMAVFDRFAFDVQFNDLGAGVLGLSGGTGSPTAGSIAGTAPIAFVGLFDLGTATFPLTGIFTAQRGGVEGLSDMLPFNDPDPIAAGTMESLFSLTFVGGAPGVSTVASSAGTTGGLTISELFFPVLFTTASATVTVTDTIPEPSTMLLLGSGLAALFAWRMRKVRA